MKKKLGPLPVWGWLAAVALGVAIYYWQKRSAGPSTVGSALTTAPVLTPTEGAFPMPPAITSGGVEPVIQYPSLGDQLENVSGLAAGLGNLYATLPFAPAQSEPQQATTGSTTVSDTVEIIRQLQDAGLVSPPPTSTGSATSQAQPHTTRAPATKRVGVSWATWKRWSPKMRDRYRAKHRNEWERYRPR